MLLKEARKLFNELRSNLSPEETKRIRKELHKKETVYNFLKKKEQEGSLTNIQKNVLKNIGRYLKNFKKDLEKLQKYQYNITYGLDYLFNKVNEEDYYKPAEIKSAFDGGYMLYESRGDKDAKLSIDEYFDIIRPYLRGVIDNHKARREWKIQLIMKIPEGLETKMKGSSFTFELVDLLEYHFHKISLNRGSSCIKSPEWLKNKGVTINPKNTKDHISHTKEY